MGEDHMDVWMLNRKILPNDLLDIFSALGNLQAQYDWVITDHSMWYGKTVRKRFINAVNGQDF